MQIILDKGSVRIGCRRILLRFLLLMVESSRIFGIAAEEPVVCMLKNRNFAISTMAMFFLGFVLYASRC